MKASSQTAGWKRILIQHGEKAVLGIVGALVLWMMFSGLQKEGLKPDKSPTNLTSRVSNGEQYIVSSPRLKQDNGGQKFKVERYDQLLNKGFEPVSIDFYSVIDPPEFPKIAKRAQPAVYPIEDVHATALVVQVALNDEKAVKQQIGAIANRADEKAKAEAKKAAAAERARLAKEAKEAKAKANQQNRGTGGGTGEGGPRKQPQKDNPLLAPMPVPNQPLVPVVERPKHPAIQNLTGITSATRGIAVVTGLIPYKKQIEEFNKAVVEGKDIIPAANPKTTRRRSPLLLSSAPGS